MADDAHRPPIKWNGATLPKGNANGMTLEVERLVDLETHTEPEGYALIKYVCRKVVHDRAEGVDTAILTITAIEPLVHGKMPTEFEHAGEAIQALRGDRTGEMTLPEDDPQGYATLVELRRQMREWRDLNKWSESELAKDVLATIPAAEGWLDRPQIMEEYLRHVDALDEDALAAATGHSDE